MVPSPNTIDKLKWLKEKFQYMHTIAIIPARGGSKGIPRKNMRLLVGKPLIAYSIENALSSRCIDKVVVSSDSAEILAYAGQYEGVTIIKRESHLAQDAITLDPVVCDAVKRTEELTGITYDTVVTLQPTSPLLTVRTLDRALDNFMESNTDTLISVVNSPHLSWKYTKGRYVPNYSERLNRQQLPDCFLETGAFLITRRCCLTLLTRFGNNVSVFEVPENESVDIDTKQDWAMCEALLKKKRIVFRVDGDDQLGLGHIYRALTLAYSLMEHDIQFICDSNKTIGVHKLKSSNMHVLEISSDTELLNWLESNKPDIYVHDCLDTSEKLMQSIKPLVGRLISFEDLGEGARVADAVINAMYEGASPHTNAYTGKNYVALRDEYLIAKPNKFSEKVEDVIVLFGGTDPLDLSSRIFALAQKYNSLEAKVNFDFILGPGYKGQKVVDKPELGIFVHKDVVRISDYMRKADIAFSSQGRTTFELASMGVPTIVLAQNEREQLHLFAQMNNGFINLGLGSEVSDEDIYSAFAWLIHAKSVRSEMHRLMLDNDLKSGVFRVRRIILGETL